MSLGASVRAQDDKCTQLQEHVQDLVRDEPGRPAPHPDELNEYLLKAVVEIYPAVQRRRAEIPEATPPPPKRDHARYSVFSDYGKPGRTTAERSKLKERVVSGRNEQLAYTLSELQEATQCNAKTAGTIRASTKWSEH